MSVGSAGQRREVADAVRRGRRRRRRCVARLWAKNHTKHRNGRHPERSRFLLFSFLFFVFLASPFPFFIYFLRLLLFVSPLFLPMFLSF